MQTATLSATLQILLARFNGQVLIPFILAAESVGIAQQTARNQLVSGKFPIKTILVGSRRFIHILDLAEYVDSLREQPIGKSKRGRPTKASKYQTKLAA
jgi:Pyocin activator protein PrtN